MENEAVAPEAGAEASVSDSGGSDHMALDAIIQQLETAPEPQAEETPADDAGTDGDSGDSGDSESGETETPPEDSEEAGEETSEEPGEEEPKPEDEPKDDEELPKDQAKLESFAKSLTRRRQRLIDREKAVEEREREVEARFQPEIQRLQSESTKNLEYAQKAVAIMKGFETNPVKGLEAMGWTVKEFGEFLVNNNQLPAERQAQLATREKSTMEQRLEQLEKETKAAQERARQVEYEAAYAKMLPEVEKDLEDYIDVETHPAASTVKRGKIAKYVLDEMIAEARRSNRKLDIEDALARVEERLADEIDVEQARARRAGTPKPEKQKKPKAKLPTKEVAPARATVPDHFESEQERDAALDRLVAQFSS